MKCERGEQEKHRNTQLNGESKGRSSRTGQARERGQENTETHSSEANARGEELSLKAREAGQEETQKHTAQKRKQGAMMKARRQEGEEAQERCAASGSLKKGRGRESMTPTHTLTNTPTPKPKPTNPSPRKLQA